MSVLVVFSFIATNLPRISLLIFIVNLRQHERHKANNKAHPPVLQSSREMMAFSLITNEEERE